MKGSLATKDSTSACPWGFVILHLETQEKEPTFHAHIGKASGHKHLQKVLGKQQSVLPSVGVSDNLYPDMKIASEHLMTSFPPHSSWFSPVGSKLL